MGDQANLGGQAIEAEDLGGAAAGKSILAIKVHTGAAGADGGPVTNANPFPVAVISGGGGGGDTSNIGTDGAATPAKSALVGATDGTNLQAVAGKASAPAGTEFGVITRNIPSGTQTVAAQATAAAPAAARLSDGAAFYDAAKTGQLPAALVGGSLSTVQPGLLAWQTSQATVGTSAVQLAASPLAARKTISVKAPSSNTVAIYVGNSAGVTTSTGFPLLPGDSIDLDIDPTLSIYAISGTAAQSAGVIEVA